MGDFVSIIITTFLISAISLFGGAALFFREKLLEKIILILVAFSAGALLAGAFLDLLPEAMEAFEVQNVSLSWLFLFVLFGFCSFFVLEQFIKWHHHHSTRHPELAPFSYLILISDAIHNFIDGLIIAGAFLAGPPAGTSVALAVALHEIPQEIGDFGILVYGGFRKAKALFLNFLSALTIVFGGIAGFFLFEKIEKTILFLLPLAAGSFIYIAATDLVPQIKAEANFKKSFFYFFVFLSGIGLILIF